MGFDKILQDSRDFRPTWGHRGEKMIHRPGITLHLGIDWRVQRGKQNVRKRDLQCTAYVSLQLC